MHDCPVAIKTGVDLPVLSALRLANGVAVLSISAVCSFEVCVTGSDPISYVSRDAELL